MSPQELRLALTTEDGQNCRIGIKESVPLTEYGNTIARVFRDGPVTLFAFPDNVEKPSLLRDIGDDAIDPLVGIFPEGRRAVDSGVKTVAIPPEKGDFTLGSFSGLDNTLEVRKKGRPGVLGDQDEERGMHQLVLGRLRESGSIDVDMNYRTGVVQNKTSKGVGRGRREVSAVSEEG